MTLELWRDERGEVHFFLNSDYPEDAGWVFVGKMETEALVSA